MAEIHRLTKSMYLGMIRMAVAGNEEAQSNLAQHLSSFHFRLEELEEESPAIQRKRRRSVSTEKKAAAARENGKKGGRPKGMRPINLGINEARVRMAKAIVDEMGAAEALNLKGQFKQGSQPINNMRNALLKKLKEDAAQEDQPEA